MEIAEPQVLAKLPRPLQGSGEIRFGPVWGFRNGVKRKRQEICACTDCDTVNVYEVRSGKNLASYAIPPTYSVFGPPCSVRRKENDIAVRQTYCALRHNEVDVHTFTTQETDPPTHSSRRLFTVENATSPVVQLDIFQDETYNAVYLVQENGDLTRCLVDTNLVTMQRLKPEARKDGVMKLLAAEIITAYTAKASVLKGRSDITRDLGDKDIILASIYTKTAASETDSGLVSDVFYGLWSIDGSVDRHASKSSDIHPLLEHKLQLQNPVPCSDIRTVSLGTSDSIVQMKTPRSLIRYNMSGTVPQRLSTLQNALLNHQDVLNMSSHYVLATFPGSIRILDVNYEVVQADLELNRTNLKRRRGKSSGNSVRDEVELITYFPQLRRCLARRRHQLISFDVKTDTKSDMGKAALTKSSLAQSIGRGTILEQQTSGAIDLKNVDWPIGKPYRTDVLLQEWPAIRKRLEQLHQQNDIEGFEHSFLHEMRLSSYKKTEKNIPHDRISVVSSAAIDAKIDYVLSKMFSIQSRDSNLQNLSDTDLVLQLEMKSRKLLKFLVRSNLLNTRTLSRALKLSSAKGTRNELRLDSIASALYRADSSARLLLLYVRANNSPDAQEHASIVKYLIELALAQSYSKTGPLLLTNKQSDDDSLPAQDSTAIVFQSPSNKPVMSSGVSEALASSLDLFGNMSPSSISYQLRAKFSQADVIALIQFMRQQLFRDGYTGMTQVQDHQTMPLPQTNVAPQGISISLNSIVTVLSGCLDNIGPMSLLSSGGGDEFVESIIPDLFSEVSRAAKNVEESSELQGILRETLRYAESKNSSSNTNTVTRGRQGDKGALSNTGQIVTLYSEDAEQQLGNGSAGVLPLSLQVENISPVKIRKGGGQTSKRSFRETMMLESRLKGSYSYERLIL